VTTELDDAPVVAETEADESPHSRRITGFLGTALLFFAAAVVLLAVIDRSDPLSFMPISWHANRALWYLLAFAAFLAGFALLRPRSASPRDRNPQTFPDRICFERVVLYTRKSCRLCDEAHETLRRYQEFLPAIDVVDIDADPQLAETFDTCVPVVEIDGKVRFRGRVNPVLLQRMIDVALQRQVGN